MKLIYYYYAVVIVLVVNARAARCAVQVHSLNCQLNVDCRVVIGFTSEFPVTHFTYPSFFVVIFKIVVALFVANSMLGMNHNLLVRTLSRQLCDGPC